MTTRKQTQIDGDVLRHLLKVFAATSSGADQSQEQHTQRPIRQMHGVLLTISQFASGRPPERLASLWYIGSRI
jgi:hypothetical protein